tara:strand:+ start:19994 stop:21022 length:1029 start_codon:yes stop_codon:yes gene_type:complete
MRTIISILAVSAGLAACQNALPVHEIHASAETVRVAGTGDAADDPALWLAPDPAQSLILGTDKTAGLYAYELDGSIHSFLPVGRLNNIDVRAGFDLPGPARDIAVATDRTNTALAVFLIDTEAREIEAWPVIPLDDVAEPYGTCLYRSPVDGALYAFVTDKDSGIVVQLLLRYDGEGRISGDEVRRFVTGSITEGCVADDRTGQLYINEENVAVWAIGAEPGDGTVLTRLAAVDGRHIIADAEGAAILDRGEAGGWLIVSSQGDSTYTAYDLESGEFAARFRISDGVVDGVTHTDGLEVITTPLGPDYPAGVMLVQDDEDDEGGQNFKIIDLREVIAVLGGD